jgi:hypothetical protein
MNPFETIVTSAVSAVGGSAIVVASMSAWLGKVWSERIARVETLLGKIDIDLRKRRIEVYKELWGATAVFPKWTRAEGVTYEELLKFSQGLRQWYFHRGGMYLSRTTHHDGYTVLQTTIEGILNSHPSGLLSEKHYDLVREKCSSLRSYLATDIESRRDALSQVTAHCRR